MLKRSVVIAMVAALFAQGVYAFDLSGMIDAGTDVSWKKWTPNVV